MYISLLPRGREVDLGGFQTPKGGLGERRGIKQFSPSVKGVHLEGQNLIRGDHKGRSKIFQHLQNSDVLQLTEPKLNPN
jgi:hypothetical protein